MTEIYALEINKEIQYSFMEAVLPHIDEEKKAKILHFRRKEDALRSLLGNLLIRYIIIKKYGIKNTDIHFDYTYHGKPYLKTKKDFHFNLSHAGDWIVAVISDQTVGIDVEKITTVDFGIAKNYFTKNERLQLFSQPKNEQLNYFFELWTCKESFIKMQGEGLSIPLDSFSISIQSKKTIIFDVATSEKLPYQIRQYAIASGYKMAVCGTSIFDNAILRHIHLDAILSFWEQHP